MKKALVFILMSGLSMASPINVKKKEDVNEILRQFVVKAEQDSKYISDNYSHEEIETIDYLKNGIIFKTEERRSLIKEVDGILSKKLISKDGVEIADAEFKPKQDAIAINAKLFQRYDFEFKRNEVIANKTYLVLSYKPRGDAPEEEKKDRILNNLEGEIWISSDNFELKKLVAKLVRGVDYGLVNFVGLKAKKMEAVIEATSIDNCFATLNVRVEFQYSAKAFFWPINNHEIITIKYIKYERGTP